MLLKSSKICYNIIEKVRIMEKIFDILANNKSMQMLCIFIVLDVIFGILRAIKERKLNSTIGIDGIIRKVGMMVTITVTIILDKLEIKKFCSKCNKTTAHKERKA